MIERDFVATILDVSLEASSYACNHSLVKHVHMTGGKPTHDAIVWGWETRKYRESLETSQNYRMQP